MALAVFKTAGRAWRGGRFDSCLFRMNKPSRPHPPAVGRILDRPTASAYVPILSRPLVTRVIREVIAELRGPEVSASDNQSGRARLDLDSVEARLARRLASLAARRIHPVLNGTGVMLHTNLGRSPIDAAVWRRAERTNTAYCNLEMDIESGERGRRGGLAPELAAELALAESAIILNNNAGAILLALRSIATGREVIVSRGEQIQIGGGFRIPEILALSGARLVEVGTTNVTSVEDYRRAVGSETACILLVHGSNFAIRGFTSKPALADLAAAIPSRIPIVVDQGSGCHEEGCAGETPLSRYLRDGAALVCFSADKLLGGPQAGIAAGRSTIVAAMRRDPMARVLRPGKTVLTLLEEHLVCLLNGTKVKADAPDPVRLEGFGQALLDALPPGSFSLHPSQGTSGGGSAPDESFPSFALVADRDFVATLGGAERLADRLRLGSPPLIALVRAGSLVVDLAALCDEDIGLVGATLAAALGIGPAQSPAASGAMLPNAMSPGTMPSDAMSSDTEA